MASMAPPTAAALRGTPARAQAYHGRQIGEFAERQGFDCWFTKGGYLNVSTAPAQDGSWEENYEAMVAACRKHNKHPGMGGVYSTPLMKRYIDIGARLILAGGDLPLMMDGAKARVQALRG